MRNKQLEYGSAQQAGMSEARVRRIAVTAEQMVTNGVTPAQVVVAARKGVIVVHQANGKFGPEPDAAELTRNALFPLCSITKLFTATAILMLVEEGLMGLNRPVVDYIPEFTGPGKKAVYVHHLLTHTSGINGEDVWKIISRKREQGVELPACPEGQDPDSHESLFYGYEVPLRTKPGQVMQYLGFGYQLLGEIVSRVSGVPYHRFVEERIFKPLGMNDTYFAVPDSERYRIVRRAPEAPCAEWIETEDLIQSMSAGGGAYGSAYDLAVFGQMFLLGGEYNGERLLSPISVFEMTRNQIPGVSSQYRDEVFPEAYWGYGWAINGSKRDGGDLFSSGAYSHWGAAGPFICVDPLYSTVTVHLSVELDHNRPFKNMYADHFNNTVLAAIEQL